MTILRRSFLIELITAQKALDINKDGKFDAEDFKHAYDKVVDVLGYQMPAGGGFTAGLIMGLRA